MTSANREEIRNIDIEIHERVANYLNNRKRREITDLETRWNLTININARTDVGPEHLKIRSTDAAGNEVRFIPPADSKGRP